MTARRTRQFHLSREDEFLIVDFGPVEILDGGDLAVLRQTLMRHIAEKAERAVGVDLARVKYVPSGFFGLLCDLGDLDAAVLLRSPNAHIRSMLWFQQFFAPIDADRFLLVREGVQPPPHAGDRRVEDPAPIAAARVVNSDSSRHAAVYRDSHKSSSRWLRASERSHSGPVLSKRT